MEEESVDSNRFDALSRSLGTRQNRRGVVQALGAAALGAAGVIGFGRPAGAKASKVGICHLTGNGGYQYISVAQSAVPAHLAHGDAVSDLTDVDNCGACGNACTAPDNATPFCGDTGCGYTCDEGFEDDGSGGCAEIPNPAVTIHFDPSSDPAFCLVGVDLVDFGSNTTYPVSVEISYASDLTTDETYGSTLTTDDDGFASGYPIGSYRAGGVGINFVRVTANGITTDWYDIEC
jgi:hypothetical protein